MTIRRPLRRFVAGAVAVLGFVLGTPPAWANVGVSASLTMPSATTFGETNVPGSFTVRNTNTPPNEAESNTIVSLRLAPSCGSTSTVGNACPTPDPGVFHVDSPAVGAAGTACAGVLFTVSEPDASGVVTFTPATPVVLAPPGGAPGSDRCTVNFTFDVLKQPTIDVAPGTPGIQTFTNLRARVRSGSGLEPESGPSVQVTVVLPPHRAVADYDDDGKTDVGVYRPSNAVWYIQRSGGGTTIVNWGTAPEDVPVVGDFDDDGRDDIAVFRPSSGLWIIQNSSGGTTIVNWGAAGDIPVPGDYDGDGKDDIAVYRPSTQVWYIRNSLGGTTVINWGAPGDIPVPGDYNGDAKTDVAVFRPSSGLWIIRSSSTGSASFINWGSDGDIPKVGDFDRDGTDDVAVYRPSNQVWYIRNSSTGAPTIVNWGSPGDIPVVGDYDGDGRDDVAVFRPSNGLFIINRSTTGLLIVNWGASGDIPLGRPPLSGP